ncbi:MAG: tetratricopeptide repeat protein [Candidatus Obscuribacterales bacterium]|nr:tetratricopeptide repeat protein [Candidatus Obscuribacterales bacterium]
MLNKSNSLILLTLISITSSLPMSQAAAPIDWDKRLAKANQQMSIGEVDQAIGMFSAEVKKHPESGAPHVALGRALKKKGKMSDAKSEFTRSTEVDPGYADAFYELGAMQENDREWQAAVSSFEQYLQLAPDADRAKSTAERLRNCKQQLE